MIPASAFALRFAVLSMTQKDEPHNDLRTTFVKRSTNGRDEFIEKVELPPALP